jgi:microcompartment protein CcmK/EutM
MFVARVLKTVVADEKHPILKGEKLMLVRPVKESGELYDKTRVAVDRAQAGVGDKVLVLQEGSSSRFIFGVESEPVHCIIVGVVDEVNIMENKT